MSQLVSKHEPPFRGSLKALLHHQSKNQPSTTHCTDCGSTCMHLPAQFWLDGDDETFTIALPSCPQCNPELLSRVPVVS